jgi:hypothetical protein
MLPALIKTYKFPETETWIFYGLGILAPALTILAIKNYTYQETVYPIYVLTINFLMLIFIMRPKISKRLTKA